MLSIVYQFTMVEHSQSSPLSHLGVLNPSVQLTIECVPSTLRLLGPHSHFALVSAVIAFMSWCTKAAGTL